MGSYAKNSVDFFPDTTGVESTLLREMSVNLFSLYKVKKGKDVDL